MVRPPKRACLCFEAATIKARAAAVWFLSAPTEPPAPRPTGVVGGPSGSTLLPAADEIPWGDLLRLDGPLSALTGLLRGRAVGEGLPESLPSAAFSAVSAAAAA